MTIYLYCSISLYQINSDVLQELVSAHVHVKENTHTHAYDRIFPITDGVIQLIVFINILLYYSNYIPSYFLTIAPTFWIHNAQTKERKQESCCWLVCFIFHKLKLGSVVSNYCKCNFTVSKCKAVGVKSKCTCCSQAGDEMSSFHLHLQCSGVEAGAVVCMGYM